MQVIFFFDKISYLEIRACTNITAEMEPSTQILITHKNVWVYEEVLFDSMLWHANIQFGGEIEILPWMMYDKME